MDKKYELKDNDYLWIKCEDSYIHLLHLFSFKTPIFSNPFNNCFRVSIIGRNIKKVSKVNSRNFTYDGPTLPTLLSGEGRNE
jgi:hypothetical protein